MAKPIYFANRFPRSWGKLTAKQRTRILEIIIALPELLENPHRHSGYGFRRVRGSAYYEARLDPRWRLILRIDDREIILFDVMNHDQVRRL